MRITSDDRLSYVEMMFQGTLSEEEVRLTGRHDIQISVEASCHGFHGQNESIWFGGDEIRRFTDEMEDLEHQWQGIAKLVSLGYPSEHTEFIMQIYTTDSAGHFAIKFDLQKLKYSRSGRLNLHKISAGFDFDPGELHNLVTDFATLFNSQSASTS